MNYGIPYQGSKGKIAKEICKIFPKAKHFYDLFGGGFSITHAMLVHRSKSFEHFHFNEIRSGMSDLIRDAILGKYSYKVFKPEFISREEFFKRKESELFIKLIWSFGNNGEDYLFSTEIEPYKRSMHNAVVFNEFDKLAKKVLGFSQFPSDSSINSRRLCLRQKIEYYRVTGIPEFLIEYLNEKQKSKLDEITQLRKLQQLEQLERLQQLQQLQQLERLQQLEKLQQLDRIERLNRLNNINLSQKLDRLNFYNNSYQYIPIQDESIIYCDIPYKGTGEYDKNKHFDHAQFLDWAHELNHPVWISEYDIPDKRFRLVKKMEKMSLMDNSQDKKKTVIEKVYINECAYQKYYKN